MEKLITFICNNELISARINPAITVLDFLRNNKRLTGTKEGCREGDCGACTILIGALHGNKVKYKSVNSCLLPIDSVNGKHVVSIEGLNLSELTYVQEQLVDEGGTQCGFCTPGFVVSVMNYFMNHSEYELDEAISSLDGNICRCTGYAGIKRSLENTISHLGSKKDISDNIRFLVQKNFLPEYFLTIPKRLKKITTELSKTKALKKNYDFTVSGGTDLYVQQWETILESDAKFISEKSELKKIWKSGNKIFIGGAVTVEEFRESRIIMKYFPQFEKQLKLFGSLPIRNRATIAGNIVNASPIADITNIFLSFDASVHLVDTKKKRTVPLKEFYLGYKKLDKKKNELIELVSVSIPSHDSLFNFEKVSRRTFLDIASVNSSISIETKNKIIKDVHISAGGVAPIPLYLLKIRKYLIGKEINIDTIHRAAEVAQSEISPISDARGCAEYKSLLLRQLIFGHFIKLFPHLVNVEEFV